MIKIATKFGIFSAVIVSLMSFTNQVALATASVTSAASTAVCKVGGKVVPCEQVGEQIKGAIGWGIAGFLFFAVLGILTTIFWVMMIVHAAKHDVENKAMWIVLMVFTGIVGAVIYYFAVKRKFNEQVQQPLTSTSSPQASEPSPINPLESYVRDARAQGMSNDQIRQALLGVGWSDDVVTKLGL